MKKGPEIGVLGEGMVGQEAVPQLSSVPRPPGFSFSSVLVTVDRPLRAPGEDSRVETPEYRAVLSCQVREPKEGGGQNAPGPRAELRQMGRWGVLGTSAV